MLWYYFRNAKYFKAQIWHINANAVLYVFTLVYVYERYYIFLPLSFCLQLNILMLY